jgi:hypothetical protein
MGYYYEHGPPEEKPPGCIDVLVMTRAVLSILLVPLAIIFAVGVGVGVAFYLYAIHPALVFVPVAAGAIGIWLYARWEQRHFRPPGM